jgi:hypothetical protein
MQRLQPKPRPRPRTWPYEGKRQHTRYNGIKHKKRNQDNRQFKSMTQRLSYTTCSPSLLRSKNRMPFLFFCVTFDILSCLIVSCHTLSCSCFLFSTSFCSVVVYLVVVLSLPLSWLILLLSCLCLCLVSSCCCLIFAIVFIFLSYILLYSLSFPFCLV